jgi:hypothetical protein
MTTAATLLQDDFASIAASAVGVLNNSEAVLRLPPITRDRVLGQVQSSLFGLHDIEIGEVLKLGWETSRSLTTVAHQSLAMNRPQDVHMDGYAIPVDYDPELEVLVNGQHIATVHFRLRLTFELFNFEGVVERGRLVRLNSDVFDVTAVLAAEDQTIARRTAHLNLKFELPVPAGGIPLVRDAWRA